MPGKYEYQPDELNALNSRGMILFGGDSWDYRGYVWMALDARGNQFVVKSIPNDSSTPMKASQSHIITVDLMPCAGTVLCAMPMLSTISLVWPKAYGLQTVLDVQSKILEGMQFLHENNTAFIDLHADNLVFSRDPIAYAHFVVPATSLFYIDYGSCRPFSRGPGTGAVMVDYCSEGGHFEPPESEEVLDPFAYDIYTLGRVFEDFTSEVQSHEEDIVFPRCMFDYYAMLAHKDPSCRPSVWRARRLNWVLWRWIDATSWLRSILGDRLSGAVMNSGWRILSSCVF